MKKIKINNKIILLSIFIISVILRVALSWNISSITTYPDEVITWDMAKAIAHGEIAFRGLKVTQFDLLYSIYLAVTTLIPDAVISFRVLLLFNAIAMSSVVFPVYLLVRKFDYDKYKWLPVIVSVIIPEMGYSAMIMQENLMYPLAIWFFVACLYVVDNYDKFYSSVVLGIASFALYMTKDVGFAFFAGTLLFYLIHIVLRKGERIQWIKNGLVYGISFVALWYGYRKLVVYLTTVSAEGAGDNAIYSSVAANLFDPKIIIACIYPLVLYLVSFALYSAVVTIVFPLSNWKQLAKREQSVIIEAVSVLLACIGVICTLILATENGLGVTYTRVHYRYFFYLAIPFWIIFWKYVDDYKFRKAYIIIPVIFIICMWLVNIIPYPGSHADAPTGFWLTFFDGDLRKPVLKLAISIFLAVIVFLLFKKKNSYIKYLVIISMLVVCAIGSTRWYAWEKMLYGTSIDYTHELQTIDDYLENEDVENLVLIGPYETSTFLAEAWINQDYLLMISDYINTMPQASELYGATMWGLGGAYTYSSHDNPDYLVTVCMEIDIQGYEEVELSNSIYHLYQRTDQEVRWY